MLFGEEENITSLYTIVGHVNGGGGNWMAEN